MAQTFTDDVYASSHTAATDLQNIENNFAAVKSNFSGTSAPSNPVDGILWKDTTNNLLKQYNGASWITIFDIANSNVPALSVNTAAIENDAVTVDKMADNSVGAAQIIDASITSVKFDSGDFVANATAGNYVETYFHYPFYAFNPVDGSPLLIDTPYFKANQTTYDKVLELVVGRTGTYSFVITFEGNDDGYIKIYKNSIAHGIEHYVHAGYSTFTEDLAFTKGDLLQFYLKTSSSDQTTIHSLYICSALPLKAVAIVYTDSSLPLGNFLYSV